MSTTAPSGGIVTAPPRSAVPAYLGGFVMVGICLSLGGPALSHLRERVGTDDGGIALIFVAQSIGYIAGSAFAGRGLDAGHGHRRWSVAMVVATVSVVAMGTAHSLAVLALYCAVLGLACGLCDVSGNTLVVWSRPDGAGALLNALHLGFAVGAMTAPVLVNRSIRAVDSVWGVAVPLGVLTVACAAWMLPRPSPVRTRLATVAQSEASGARGVHVAAVCAFFFTYVALEVGFANWIHTYTEQIGDTRGATGVTTMFGVGFALGRLLAIPAARALSAGWIVGGTTVATVAVAIAFVVVRGPGPGLWVVTLCFGFCVAPQYASMMAFAEQHLALSGRNTSAIVGASGVGGLVLPYVLGQLFDGVGPEALPPVVLVLSIACAVVVAWVGRLLSSHRPPATSMNEPVT